MVHWRAPDRVAEAALSSEVRHALVQKTVGFYRVFLPPDYAGSSSRRYPLCVLLHGQGSSESAIAARLLPAIGREDLIFAAPRAPHAHEEVFLGGQSGWRAWPMHWPRWRDPDFPREDVDAAGVPALYTDWIRDCVLDARRRYRVADERALLVGHSEGATYAHAFACHYPDMVRAYFASAGGPYEFTLGDDACARALLDHDVRPFLAHARSDAENAFEGSRSLAAYFEERGVPFGSFFPAGTEHALTAETLERVRSFVRDWAAPAATR